MAVWSEVKYSDLGGALRLDAEYYKPEYLKYAQSVGSGDSLLEVTRSIIHPIEIKRVYEEDGIQILLAQNIRHNYLDFGNSAYMSVDAKTVLARNRLQLGDVVMTRSGVNFGDAACYLGNPVEIYACADCLIIRPRKIPPGYLSTYLNTKIGRGLLTRGSYGAAQPHIAPNYLKGLGIIRIGPIEERVHDLVVKSYQEQMRSKLLYAEAETLLLSELGLNDLDLSHELFYESRFSETQEAGRIDAEYFQPKYYRLIENLEKVAKIKMSGQVSNLKISPSRYGTSAKLSYVDEGVPFLRIADLENKRFDLDSVLKIPLKEAQAEKTARVKEGDVLVSRTGTLGIAVAIPPQLDGAIFGSYLIRVRPNLELILPEYLALYINTLAGALQVERVNTGAIQTNLTVPAIESLFVVYGDKKWQEKFVEKINESVTAREESKRLLEDAKRMVEDMVLGTGA